MEFRKEYEKEFQEKGFGELADYNARVRKGIVHTKGYAEKMKELQEDYNKWVIEREKNNGTK